MDILLNHIGFNSKSGKFALAAFLEPEGLSDSAVFTIVSGGRAVYSGRPGPESGVRGWKGRHYYHLDFTDLADPGEYRIRIEDRGVEVFSPVFRISERLIFSECISDILSYFKSQRCSGGWDEADRQVSFCGERPGTADVSGGWYDASGDYSKYLSHLSYADYFNPQQTPLAVWSLLRFAEAIDKDEHAGLKDRAVEEGLYGADFLLRMQDPDGYFYTTVFDKWSGEPERRMIASYRGQDGLMSDDYQAGMRQGGGMAIAALSRAARSCNDSLRSAEYRRGALRAWEHLQLNNTAYLDNGRENIIDRYCALTAAAELYKTSGERSFRDAAAAEAAKLGRLYDHSAGLWRVEENMKRPFFHPSDAGFPILALIEYCGIEEPEQAAGSSSRQLLRTAVRDLADLAGGNRNNPFMLARQRVKGVSSNLRASFFMPHDNETGYWWQGENAALASLSYAVRRALPFFDSESESDISRLEDFADAQIHWILGRNPFDICMLHGHGRNNPGYEDGSPNTPGGICNGITAGFEDEDDISFLPSEAEGKGDHRWRWSEQWMPHAAWFLLALSEDT